MALVRLFYSLAVLLKLALSVDHVPMLLWSTHSSLWNSEATLHEGHIISKQELHMLLQPVFTQDSKNLVLFLQDTLSIDDFTHYSESYENEKPFHNVQELLESSSSSLVLSAVDCQATSYLLDYLQESMDWKLTDIDEFEVSKLKVDTSKPNIFVVKLQPISRLNDISTANAFAANEMLTAGLINDLLLLLFKSITKFPLTSELVVSDPKFTKANKIIGRLTMSLQKQGIQFSVIYTAMRPSRIPRRPNVVLESRRRLLATEAQVTDAYYPLNVTNGTSTCILFYASNFSLTANKSVHADLTNLTFVSRKVDFSSSVCSDTNSTLSLNYTGLVDGINNLKIRFLMTKKFYTGSARKWFTLDSVEIAHDNQMVARFNVSIISAPAEYSFHCQLVGTSSLYGAKLIPANSDAKNWDVYLSEFQIQGFNIHNNLFSYASDCTSFFSPGIWMGLVTSIVLLWILTYGIHMIMQLTTNSRFDDPKGQALSVPQTE